MILYSLPHHSLPLPVDLGNEGAQMSFSDWVFAFSDLGQKENILLDVGGEMKEVHDLGNTSLGDVG